MNKVLVFDMDGTIADLYNVDNWLDMIRNENVTPYAIAQPMYDMSYLADLLTVLKSYGWRVVVTSWTSKGGSKDYNNNVATVKKMWLNNFGFPYDEIHIVKYGTTKANCTRKLGGYQVLVDDNEKVRKGWTLGATINANENILKEIENLVLTEINS